MLSSAQSKFGDPWVSLKNSWDVALNWAISFTIVRGGIIRVVLYSAKRWQRKTLLNQQNIALAKKLWRIANLEDQAEI